MLNAQQQWCSERQRKRQLVKTRVTVTRRVWRSALKTSAIRLPFAAINKLLDTAVTPLAKAESYNKAWQKLPQVNGQNAALTDDAKISESDA